MGIRWRARMQMIFDDFSPNLGALLLQQMLARTKSFLVYVLVYLATTVQAFASCDTYSKETVDNFEFTNFCTASINRPFYRVVDHCGFTFSSRYIYFNYTSNIKLFSIKVEQKTLSFSNAKVRVKFIKPFFKSIILSDNRRKF